MNFRANGATITNLEDHHYYPFGMKMEGIGSSAVTNKYTYNSKELNEDFALNWHDYGARWYDAALGRWGSVDPMAEPQANYSPYAYTYNNPLAFVDPTGMYGEPVGADGLTNSQWVESSRPGNSWLADSYRKQNRQEDWLRSVLIGKIDGVLQEDDEPDDTPPYMACPVCPYLEVHKALPVTVSAKRPANTATSNWLRNATAATHARRDMVGNDVSYLYTFADDTPGYWVEALNLIFMAEGAVDVGFWAAGRLAARTAARAGYVNLASSGRTAHIIAGDVTGGGHAWFGSLKSFVNGLTGSKSMFPMSWSNSKIMHAVSEVTISNPWIQQTGRVGEMFTRSGQPVRFVVEGTYQGTKIRVITTRTDIITAFPVK